MGLFSSGTNKAYDPVKAGYANLAGDWGTQAGGNTERTGELWNRGSDIYGQYQGLLDQAKAGAFATPGQGPTKGMVQGADFLRSMLGAPGMTGNRIDTGVPFTFANLASGKPGGGSYLYDPTAMRARTASGVSALGSSMFDTLRNAGNVAGAGANPAMFLNLAKNTQSGIRQGIFDAESEAANQAQAEKRYGLENMMSTEAALAERERQNRRSPGGGGAQSLAQQMGILGAMGDYANWGQGAGLAQGALSGEGSALSGWGNTIGAATTPSMFSQIMRGGGTLAGAAAPFFTEGAA